MAFTLREVARRAGVSHNAPYRHFRNKDDLIASVAAEGYTGLTDAMRRAAATQSRPIDRLKHAGLAYIEFALRRPEHFTVMFDAPMVAGHGEAAAGPEAKEAFNTLVELVSMSQQEKQLPSGDPLQFAFLAWTMVHGVAKLATTGRLPYRNTGAILKFASFVIDQSLPVKTSPSRQPSAKNNA
jgi:AcrR family transcriptional regulator